jgi:hypothetical protein
MMFWERDDSWWRRYCKDHAGALMMLPDRQVRGLPWCAGCLSSWVSDREMLERVIEDGVFPEELIEIARGEAQAKADRTAFRWVT